MTKLTVQTIMALPGFEEAVSAYLTPPKRESISSWARLTDFLRFTMGKLTREQFRVLFLNHRNLLLADEVMGEGSISHAPVYPREVARRALEVGAAAVILVHNHPSGDPTPSTADVDMTKRVRDALAVLSITVHDHCVVSAGEVASFRQLGLL